MDNGSVEITYRSQNMGDLIVKIGEEFKFYGKVNSISPLNNGYAVVSSGLSGERKLITITFPKE